MTVLTMISGERLKFGTKNSVFCRKTASEPSLFKNLNTPIPPKTFSTQFQPVTYEDKEDKVKVGRQFKNRQVKIMQFSEQIHKSNPCAKMNSVELRLGYLKNNSEQYKTGNSGYNRDSLVKTASKNELITKSSVFEFNKKSSTLSSNPFNLNSFNPKLTNSTPFNPNPTNPFNPNPFKTSPFTLFIFPKEGEKLQVLHKNKDTKSTETNVGCHNCLGPNNKPSVSETTPAFKFTFPQTSSIKQPEKPVANIKVFDAAPDSLILQHSKSKIIKHMELRNSIQNHLNNQPFDHDQEQLKNNTPVNKPVEIEQSIVHKMSSSSRRHLFKTVRPTFDLSKPKTNQTKSKNAKTSQIAFSNSRKITMSQIKVRVVHTKNI